MPAATPSPARATVIKAMGAGKAAAQGHRPVHQKQSEGLIPCLSSALCRAKPARGAFCRQPFRIASEIVRFPCGQAADALWYIPETHREESAI